MPIDVKYLDGGKGTLFVGNGFVTGKDILMANEEIFSSEEKTRRYRYALTDFSSVDDFDVSTSDIEEIARTNMSVAEILPDYIVAVVAQKDVSFGLSRMWQIHLGKSTWETKVLRTDGEAKAWIKERVKAKFGIDVTIT